jgi:hypothetical protein
MGIPNLSQKNINLGAKQSSTLSGVSSNMESKADIKADDASEQIAENRAFHIIVPALWGIIFFLVGYYSRKTPNEKS